MCKTPITLPRTSIEVSNCIIVVARGQIKPLPTKPTKRKSTHETQNKLAQAKSVRINVKITQLNKRER